MYPLGSLDYTGRIALVRLFIFFCHSLRSTKVVGITAVAANDPIEDFWKVHG